MRLIDDWKAEFHRLWVIRVSLAVGVFTGVAAVIGAFADTLNPWALVVISVFVNVAVIPLARLAKQEDKPAPPAPAVTA